MGSIKSGSIKKDVIVGAITGFIVIFLVDRMNPALAILIGVAFGIALNRSIAKIWNATETIVDCEKSQTLKHER